MSAGVLAVATACGGGGGGASTAATPADVLDVTVAGAGDSAFRVALRCGVADREACAGVLDALASADAERCDPLPDDRSAITVRGVIDGEPVAATLRRRTTCEARAYDRAVAALGL